MGLRRMILSGGCFWGVQYYFDQVPGVIKTTVGYTGGHTASPTYEDVCSHDTGHAEAVLIEFDPDMVVAEGLNASAMQGAGEQRTEPYRAYGEEAAQPATQQRAASFSRVNGSAGQQTEAFQILLKHFFRMHDPTQLNRQGPDVGDQYRSAIFYTDEEQKTIAESVKKGQQANFKEQIVTEIIPAGEFYPAEDYHQKYAEKTGHGMCHVAYEPL